MIAVEGDSYSRLSHLPLTNPMCHFNVISMKTASIRELRHDTTTVLGWVKSGERVEIQRRGQPVAILSLPTRRAKVRRPDFAARLKSIYGTQTLPVTATVLLSEERGER
jgi:antitoxin (DNA-binding transcriptional repressor) of toxin-antitoxin stability system